jgi:large subunit ribosomal protein L25
MEQIKIKAQKREETGKRVTKDLRKQGIIPAVVYRKGQETLPVSISERELIHALHTEAGENVIINLQISGTEKKNQNKTVIIKEIQHHPIKGNLLHIDFNEISLTETITVKVPIETKGEAMGVKRDGGVLEHMLWELEIECLPTEIPEKIEVEVEKLEIGGAIHVKDLIVPSSIKVLNDPEAMVVAVEPPRIEEVKEEAPPEEVAAEPELIRKEREGKEEAEAPQEQPKEQEGKKEESKEK